VCATACSTSPDVVAKSTSSNDSSRDATFGPLPSYQVCTAGTYTGIVNSLPPGDGGPTFPLSGTITFVLEETRQGEFEVIANAQGLTGKGSDDSQFAADIPSHGGGCYEGVFKASLMSGLYTLPNGTTTFPFTGAIQGNYLPGTPPAPPSFSGSWNTITPLTAGASLHVGGIWYAYKQQ
jgi:hypothetical protein